MYIYVCVCVCVWGVCVGVCVWVCVGVCVCVSKFTIITMLVIIYFQILSHTQFFGYYHLHTKLHMPAVNGPLLLAIKGKMKDDFLTFVLLLLYI
jgi:hypothetical protein